MYYRTTEAWCRNTTAGLGRQVLVAAFPPPRPRLFACSREKQRLFVVRVVQCHYSPDFVRFFSDCLLPSLAAPRARALTNDFLVKKLLDVYLAYEALTDHPYAFSSVVHGFYPLMTSWDAGNELEVNINLEKYIDQRDEHVIDMDCSAVWLALSMLSPMLFSRRLQFSYNTPVAFCPQNRKSNILKLPARGPAPRSGDVEAGDGGALQEYVEEQDGGLTLGELLGRMTLEELRVLYGKCFGSKLLGVDR